MEVTFAFNVIDRPPLLMKKTPLDQSNTSNKALGTSLPRVKSKPILCVTQSSFCAMPAIYISYTTPETLGAKHPREMMQKNASE